MNKKDILLVRKECKRVLDSINEVEDKIEKVGEFRTFMGSKETSKLRRASMDLTRSLSELRKSEYEKARK